MSDRDQWEDYYFALGLKDGRLEGYCVGGFWGFFAGFATFFFLWLWS